VIVLLDTHALLWALEGGRKLSSAARNAIEDAGNVVLASSASAWEIVVKKALGKLSAPDDLELAVEAAGFTKRTITFADAHRVGTLPAHHRDPFDRILVAQALGDGVPIVSADAQIARYGVAVIW
jgi:PIN domain nuclease of toxin-antitoxin system